MIAEALMGLGTGAVAGLASIPHCAGMCGPLSGFACARSPSRLAPLRYQAGRMVAYGVAGGAIGQVGEVFTQSLSGAWTSAILSWMLAVALGFAAFQLWRVARPRLATVAPPIALRAAPSAPGLVDRVLRALPRDPFVFGLATALLPCGALYAAFLLAAGTTSAAGGAAVMLGFATTSGVALVGAAWLARRLRALASPLSLRLLAVALAVGAVFLAIRPLPTLSEPEAKPACCAAME